MQYFRGNLTRLKQNMMRRLPEDKNLFGFQGLDKEILIKAVESTYELSKEIDDSDNNGRFEIIALKKYCQDVNITLNKILDTRRTPFKKNRNDEFISKLSTLIEKTKITYFIVTKNGIRDDIELAILKEKTDSFYDNLNELTGLQENYQESVDSIVENVENINTSHETAKIKTQELENWNDQASGNFSKIEEIHNSIEGWDNDIEQRREQVEGIAKDFEGLSFEATVLKDKLTDNMGDADINLKELNDYSKRNSALLKEITETLGDANRVGMAASFKERKEELTNQQRIWASVFFTAIASIVWMSVKIVLPDFKAAEIDIQQLIIKIAMISPLVWLGWFSVKQYS